MDSKFLQVVPGKRGTRNVSIQRKTCVYNSDGQGRPGAASVGG